MVDLILKYVSSVCDPHTNINIQKLECVQRCARFCLGYYSKYSSVKSIVLFLDILSLQFRRKLAKLPTIHKIINDNLHITSNSLIPNNRD